MSTTLAASKSSNVKLTSVKTKNSAISIHPPIEAIQPLVNAPAWHPASIELRMLNRFKKFLFVPRLNAPARFHYRKRQMPHDALQHRAALSSQNGGRSGP